MKSEKISTFLDALSDEDCLKVFAFEFPSIKQLASRMKRSKTQEEKIIIATKLYDHLEKQFEANIDNLRERVRMITNPRDWWIDAQKSDISLEELIDTIKTDDTFLQKFPYLEDLIVMYRQTEDEQTLVNLIFSLFSHENCRKDFYEYFAGRKIGKDIEEKFGYAIAS
jgi:hypothetical protein